MTVALVIGFGSIGKRHARNIRKLCPSCRLIVVRRHVTEHDDEIRSLGAELVGSLDEALRAGVDLAVVANPSALHAETVVRLLTEDVPCYVEKPTVTTRADVARVRQHLSKSSSPPVTFAGFNLRFLPSLQAVREILRAGRIGTVVRADLQVGRWLPAWRPGTDYRKGYSARAALGGGVVFDLVHELDAVRWLLGGEFEVRGAIAGRFSCLEIDSNDTACAVLARRRGPPAVTVGMDYVDRRGMRRYTFVGEEGTLVWDLQERTVWIVDETGVEQVAVPEQGFDMSETYVRAMAEFLGCVQRSEPTSQDIEEGLHSTELALAVMEAAAA